MTLEEREQIAELVSQYDPDQLELHARLRGLAAVLALPRYDGRHAYVPRRVLVKLRGEELWHAVSEMHWTPSPDGDEGVIASPCGQSWRVGDLLDFTQDDARLILDGPCFRCYHWRRPR